LAQDEKPEHVARRAVGGEASTDLSAQDGDGYEQRCTGDERSVGGDALFSKSPGKMRDKSGSVANTRIIEK